jgi:hypothetical protein
MKNYILMKQAEHSYHRDLKVRKIIVTGIKEYSSTLPELRRMRRYKNKDSVHQMLEYKLKICHNLPFGVIHNHRPYCWKGHYVKKWHSKARPTAKSMLRTKQLQISYTVFVYMGSESFEQVWLYVTVTCFWHARTCFSSARDDEMTLHMECIFRVWNHQGAPRYMLPFDIYSVTRKEIHEGVSFGKQTLMKFCKQWGSQLKGKKEASVARRQRLLHTRVRKRERNALKYTYVQKRTRTNVQLKTTVRRTTTVTRI